MSLIANPKEVKRHRDRERYAQNRDEINKRRREAYKQKKIAAAEISGAHAQLAVSQGNDDQISLSMPQLNWHVIIFSSSVQTLMRLRIGGKGSVMHRIERKY